MADDSALVEEIGETAGLVWHTLQDQGPLTFAKLAKMIDAPRDLVMQAVGWLAREGKVNIEMVGRNRAVASRE